MPVQKILSKVHKVFGVKGKYRTDMIVSGDVLEQMLQRGIVGFQMVSVSVKDVTPWQKKYVVENAKLHCQYGEQSWLLVPEKNRHIGIGGKMMANETDYKRHAYGSFGTCHEVLTFPRM